MSAREMAEAGVAAQLGVSVAEVQRREAAEGETYRMVQAALYRLMRNAK
jgi:hypothetical protein